MLLVLTRRPQGLSFEKIQQKSANTGAQIVLQLDVDCLWLKVQYEHVL
jgi:hypothetical protein